MEHVDPSALLLQYYPAPLLRAPAREIDKIDDGVRAVATRMVEMMFEHQGIGLAAPQVGLSWRMFVAHVPPDPEDPESQTDSDAGVVTATESPMVFINPELSGSARDLTPLEEGCLSLPEIRGEVIRPSEITVRARGLDTEPFEVRVGGLLAKVVQHESDHLDGTLIIDKMTQMSRLKVRAAVRQLEREG